MAYVRSMKTQEIPTVGNSQEVLAQCARVRALQNEGRYEEACRELEPFWEGVGQRSPAVDQLPPEIAAEVLLCTGTLTGYVGSVRQVTEAQEGAKNLLSEAEQLFISVGRQERAAQCESELGYCYWRNGSYDEARVWLQQAVRTFGPDNHSEEQCSAVLRLATVEHWTTRFHDALTLLREAAPHFEHLDAAARSRRHTPPHALLGNFHNEFGIVLEIIGVAEERQDYIDHAIIEYTAASHHFKEAGHESFFGRVENNLGFLLFTVKKFTEAHERLSVARSLFKRLKDNASAAQVDDTRARAFLAEGKMKEAEEAARQSVRVLENGDEQAVLAASLTTLGTILARRGKEREALASLQRAAEVSSKVDASESAGVATLTMIEELTSKHIFPVGYLLSLYREATRLLRHSQHRGLHKRLRSAAELVIDEVDQSARAQRIGGDELTDLAEQFLKDSNRRHSKRVAFSAAAKAHLGTMRLGIDQKNDLRAIVEGTVIKAQPDTVIEGRPVEIVALRNEPGLDFIEPWKGFSLVEAVEDFENSFIKLAMADAGGQVTNAARLLGYKHHETLRYRLANINRDAGTDRRKIVKRRGPSIITKEIGEVRGRRKHQKKRVASNQ